MNESKSSTLVMGHRNPDTDAIASAVGYAWLLNATDNGQHGPYSAGRTGEVNAQTAFVLSRFNVEPPPLVVDVWGRVGDLTEQVTALKKGQNLLDAIKNIAATRRPAPVLDEEKRPMGLISGAALFGTLAEALSSTSVLALAHGLDQPVETAIDPKGVILNAEERIRDVITQVLRADQDEFMVVDSDSHYRGLVRKSALLAPPRRKMVIVDHNELQQAVPGLEDGELIEVLDHHRLGNLPTAVPIRFTVEPVGSCSTLVAERGMELETNFPPPIAGLLLCGILSDTLVFRSPTTTARDKKAASWLAKLAQLSAANGDMLPAIEELGGALLAAGAGLGARSGEDVINTDLKFYEAGGSTVGIAQVEIANFRELTPRLPDIREALQKLAEARKLALIMLMVTDVVRGNSRLVVVGQSRLIGALPYVRMDDETLDAPGVVSRKKQLLPAVLAAISQVM